MGMSQVFQITYSQNVQTSWSLDPGRQNCRELLALAREAVRTDKRNC